ncbi:unnamed protein product, partial [Rotaria sp. Silwood1]
MKANTSTPIHNSPAKFVAKSKPKTTPYPPNPNPFEIKKLPLSPSTKEYIDAVNRFQSTMTAQLYTEILHIEHIWNKR